MFDALFFDLDGTLIDTESIALSTGIAAFAAAGVAVDAGFMHGLIGLDQASVAQIIRSRFPQADLDAIRHDWGAGFDAGVNAGLPLKPGVMPLLQATEGRRRALVTSTARAGAHHKLAVAGLAGFFDHVVTFDDVTEPKPAPAPYLLAAELFGCDPARCLVFEDSEIGAEAAWRAGCTVVQVPDILPSQGRWAHHLAPDLLTGARSAGLIGPA